MKNLKYLTLGTVAVMLIATLVFGGVKDMEVVKGSVAITLTGVDSTGFIEIDLGQISEMTGSGSPLFENKAWSRIVGSVIMPDLSDAGDSISGEAAIDTGIFRYKFRTLWHTVTAETDTVTLPGTTSFVIADDIWAEYTESIYGDSTAATVKPLMTNDFLSFLMDKMIFEYYVSDSSGSSGVLIGTMQYYFKFVEDE